MKIFLSVIINLFGLGLKATPFTLHVLAPEFAGQAVLLYRYDDLFTMRTVQLSEAVFDANGNAVLSATVDGTTKGRLRIGELVADLYMRSGQELHVRFPLPDPSIPKSLNGNVRVDLTFLDLSPLDVNALTTDLNERIDAFILADLATDEEAGMLALEAYRQRAADQKDSLNATAMIQVAPTWSAARLDSFEFKLRHFYREVEDAWFLHYLEYALAGMRQGPRAKAMDLHERYLKGRTVGYDDPEYVRFISGLFAEHLMAVVHRDNETELSRLVLSHDADSLKMLFAEHDLLKDDDRLCELVMIDQLYLNANSDLLPRKDLEQLLQQVAEHSVHPEHRTIAANMHWDLTAMRAGQPFPMLRLQDLRGRDVALDSLMHGAVCIAVTASWCTYCELEMVGLENLNAEYEGIVPVIAISLDHTLDELKRYLRNHPESDLQWLHAVAEQQLREDMRLRSLPAFFLIRDGVLVSSPAPMPSEGLGEWFHRAKVEAARNGRIKVWDD